MKTKNDKKPDPMARETKALADALNKSLTQEHDGLSSYVRWSNWSLCRFDLVDGNIVVVYMGPRDMRELVLKPVAWRKPVQG